MEDEERGSPLPRRQLLDDTENIDRRLARIGRRGPDRNCRLPRANAMLNANLVQHRPHWVRLRIPQTRQSTMAGKYPSHDSRHNVFRRAGSDQGRDISHEIPPNCFIDF